MTTNIVKTITTAEAAKMKAAIRRHEKQTIRDAEIAFAKAYDLRVALNEAAMTASMAVSQKRFVNRVAVGIAAARTIRELNKNFRKEAHAAAKESHAAAKEAHLAARKAAQAAKAAELATNRKSIAVKLTTVVYDTAGADGFEVDIDFDNVPAFYTKKAAIGTAAMTRSRMVYGGPRTAVQCFEVVFDPLTKTAVYDPQVQELADSLQSREGWLKPAKYPVGYVTLAKKQGTKLLKQIWAIKKEGITEEVLPLILGGDKKAAAAFELKLVKSRKPLLFHVDGKGDLKILIYVPMVVDTGEKGLQKEDVYVDVSQSVGQDKAIKLGENAFEISQVKEMIDRENNFAAGLVAAGVKHMPWRAYTVDNDSSSTVRKGAFVLRKMDYVTANEIFDEEHYAEKRDAIVNDIGANVGFILNEISLGKEVRADKLVKKVGRPSLLFTNSARGLKPQAMMFFTGEFGNGNKFADGYGFLSENYARRMMASYGYEDVKAVAGTGFQCRIVTSKGYVLTVSRNTMSNLIRNVASGIQNKAVKFVDINDRAAVHRAAVAIENGDENYKNRLVMIAPAGTLYSDVEYFADSNMLKAAFDFDGAKEISIMEMCHPSHGTSTSSQILNCAATIPGFHDIVMEIAKETIDRIFSFKASKILSHKDVKGFDKFAEGVLSAINSDFVCSDENMLNNHLKTMIKAAKNRINDLKFDVEGGYMKALPDLGGFFGIQLLKQGEIYSPDLKRNAGQKAVVVRYPHTAAGEFLMSEIVDLNTIRKRIMEADQLDRFALWSMIKSIKKGQIMLPSLVKGTVAKLGGSDFDGDGVMAILDKRIINLYSNLEESAVDFEPKQSDTKLLFDKFAVETARAYGLENGNMSTGQVVNFFYLLRSLRLDIELDLITQKSWERLISLTLWSNPWRNGHICMINKNNKAIEYTKYSFDKEGNPVKAIAPKDGDIDTYSPWDMFKRIAKADSHYDDYKKIFNLITVAKNGQLNNDEVDMFVSSVVDNKISLTVLKTVEEVLKGLDPAGASIVGRIIDAVKTGEKVTVPFAFLSDFIRDGGKIDCQYEEGANKLTISPEIGFSWNWDNQPTTVSGYIKTYYVTHNPVYYIKKELVDYVNSAATEFYDSNVIKKEKILNPVAGVTAKVAEKMAQITTSMINMRVQNVGEELYTPNPELISHAVSMFRMLTYSKAPEDRYLLAKIASKISDKQQSRFYQNLGAEAVLTALNGTDREIATEIFARNEDITAYEGEEISIVGGIGDKFFTEHKITATGRVRFVGRKTYMVSSLRAMAEQAIEESVKERKVVFGIRVEANKFDANKRETSVIAKPLAGQVAFLKTLIGCADESRKIHYVARGFALNRKVTSKEDQFDRLVVGEGGGIACLVCDYGASGVQASRALHDKEIAIDHVIMVSDKYGYVFGRIC